MPFFSFRIFDITHTTMSSLRLNHLLLNSLISVDFLLLKNNYLFTNVNVFNTILLNKKTFIGLLNPFELIINLKQFFRVIQFVKKQDLLFNILVQDIHQKSIINNFLVLNKLSLKFQIFFKFLVLKKTSSSQFFLMLKNYCLKAINFSNFFLQNKCLLVQEINTKRVQNNFNTYKMFNDTLDFKKLVFILIFIRQIWQK